MIRLDTLRDQLEYKSTKTNQFGGALWNHFLLRKVLSFKSIHEWIQAMSDWKARITTNPDQCGGRPCIRGLRIRVVDILDLLGAGLSRADVLEELPDLEAEDIDAAILYARSRIDHPVIAA